MFELCETVSLKAMYYSQIYKGKFIYAYWLY